MATGNNLRVEVFHGEDFVCEAIHGVDGSLRPGLRGRLTTLGNEVNAVLLEGSSDHTLHFKNGEVWGCNVGPMSTVTRSGGGGPRQSWSVTLGAQVV